MLIFQRRLLSRAVGAAIACATLIAGVGYCGTAGAASGKKFTIYVSNNYIGNAWRAQMENAIQAIAKRPEYKDKVNLIIVNSENTVTSQTASLQTIIRKKPAGILIDSASTTALNPTVKAACAAGIVVYTFDQTLTAPCAVQVREHDKLEAENMARWLAAAIHENGDVLVVDDLTSVLQLDLLRHFLAEGFQSHLQVCKAG